MIDDNTIKGISPNPGVYLMKDDKGKIIYVGKAINLQKRVASYFQRTEALAPKTALMVSRIADIETIVTASEKEALILESNLIKRHRPWFNVILKDDKRYPSIRIDIRTTYPRIEIVRKTPKDGAAYFGPFTSAIAMRQTIKLIHKNFPLRKCSDRTLSNRSRPCIQYQMSQCLAPCCLTVDPADYQQIVKEVILFLKGRTLELIRRIRSQMVTASDRQEFEMAAVLRDRMLALEKTVERQVTVTTDFMDRDVLGMHGNNEFKIITIMALRHGFLQGIRHFELPHAAPEQGELISQFLGQYYLDNHKIPKEILVPHLPENKSIVEDALSERRGKRVRILRPRRGEKYRLLEMAGVNAENTLRELLQKATGEAELLEALRRRLHMDRPPVRIECFDNSNLAGTNPVSAMVVFVNGRPHKAGYRRYAIRSVTSSDDYASMAEVLSRRFAKIDHANPEPDLLLVDGGKGQLGIAVSVMDQLGLTNRFAVAGIAKPDREKRELDDKIYLPNRVNPVSMGSDGRLLLLLQQIRDEAHRFAISYQRKRRRRKTMRSALDEVAGIGPKRKAALLKHFGSIKKIRAATVEQLSELPGINLSVAEAIKRSLS